MHEDDREDEGITEYDQFKKIERENVFKEGDLVFLVGSRWFNLWRDFANFPATSRSRGPPPGQILNAFLLLSHPSTLGSSSEDDVLRERMNSPPLPPPDLSELDSLLSSPSAPTLLTQTLRPGLTDNVDYQLVSGPAFRFLAGAHGFDVCVPRFCRSTGLVKGDVRVDVLPVRIRIFRWDRAFGGGMANRDFSGAAGADLDDDGLPKELYDTLTFSKYDTGKSVLEQALQLWEDTSEKDFEGFKLWNYSAENLGEEVLPGAEEGSSSTYDVDNYMPGASRYPPAPPASSSAMETLACNLHLDLSPSNYGFSALLLAPKDWVRPDKRSQQGLSWADRAKANSSKGNGDDREIQHSDDEEMEAKRKAKVGKASMGSLGGGSMLKEDGTIKDNWSMDAVDEYSDNRRVGETAIVVSTSITPSRGAKVYGSCDDDVDDYYRDKRGGAVDSASGSKKRGLKGLRNLGNTCFMNSSLQCLAHCDVLREYFRNGKYKDDLNVRNPLGTGGDLARQFAKLMKDLWEESSSSSSSSYSSSMNSGYGNYNYGRNNNYYASSGSVVAPTDFKFTLGKHAAQFSGYDQHDSQELLAFLLDILHEDTNRITAKPYVEKGEQKEGETDEEAARAAWSLHKSRESSMLQDTFLGQYKSVVRCPTAGCGRVSTTFDPFMYLTADLPGGNDSEVTFKFFPSNNACRKTEVTMTVQKGGTIGALKDAIIASRYAVRLGLKPGTTREELRVADLWKNTLFKTFDDDEADAEPALARNTALGIFHVGPPLSLGEASAAAGGGAAGGSEQDGEDVVVGGEGPAAQEVPESEYNWKDEIKHFETSPGTIFYQMKGGESMEWQLNASLSRIEKIIKKCENICERWSENPTMMDAKLKDPLDYYEGTHVRNVKDEASFRRLKRAFEALYAEKNQAAEELRKARERDGIVISVRHCVRKKITYNGYASYNTRQDLESVTDVSMLRLPGTATIHDMRKAIADSVNRVEKKGSIAHDDDKDDGSGDENAPSLEAPSAMSDDHLSSAIFRLPVEFERKKVGAAGNYNYNAHLNKWNDDYMPYVGQMGAISEEDVKQGGLNTKRAYEQDHPVNRWEQFTLMDFLRDPVVFSGTISIVWPSEHCFLASFAKGEFEIADKVSADESGSKDGVLRLVDCVKKFSELEQLSENEMWYCNKCKEHVQAYKCMHLWRAPPILIFSLKRFSYSGRYASRSKIETLVDFPLEGLDLRELVLGYDETSGEPPPIYDCFAVSNHFGGLGGGHYTAYAKNAGVWCNFDDSTVTENVNPKDVVSKSAYVLFYQKRGCGLEACPDGGGQGAAAGGGEEDWTASNRKGSLGGGGGGGAARAPSPNNGPEISKDDYGSDFMDPPSNMYE